MKRLKIAILGTGKLATDLLVKVLGSSKLECVAFVGRNENSYGISFAKNKGVYTSFGGIQFLVDNPRLYDLVFDVTNAQSHLIHNKLLSPLDKYIIDLTPSHTGAFIVPSINLQETSSTKKVNLVSCGGQTAIPLIHEIVSRAEQVEAIEVVSTIAAKSAGKGTRINIDEYIGRTELAVSRFSGCQKVKVILVLNPAVPEIDMKTTLYIKGKHASMHSINEGVSKILRKMQDYVPGYSLKIPPSFQGDVLMLTVQVVGRGDYLPCYAGNLDIINCAAIQVAEEYAMRAV